MERSVTPWRVLDAEAGIRDPDTGHAGREVSGGSPPWRAWPVLGGLAAAVALGIAAVAVIASGPTPVAIVQADAAPVAAAGATLVPGSAGAAVAPADIVVHVAGAVRRPGIVTIPTGSRVADAIEAAGGLGPRVDAARLSSEVNLAAVVADGERVVIPSRDDPATASAGTGSGATTGAGAGGGGTGGSSGGGPVDLNHATAAELEALPGIGEVTAAKIIDARTERPFSSVDELLERKVVGAATLAKFRDLVVVR